MRKAKTIAQIYEEVKDFDIVLANDPALKDGLNQMIKKPVLGQFCYTPKELASDFASFLFDDYIRGADEIILYISQRNSISIKQAHHIFSKLTRLWEDNGSYEKTMSMLDEYENSIAESVREIPSIWAAMEKFNSRPFLKGRKVAVAGKDWFTPLDMLVVPADYKTISLFLDEKTELENFFVFESEKEMISKLADMITAENQEDSAVIVPVGSRYSSVAKARLVESGVNIQTKSFLKDSISAGFFIGLIELGFGISNAKLKDVMPYLELFDKEIDGKYANYQLSYYVSLKNKNLDIEKLYEFLVSIQKKTYLDVISLLSSKMHVHPELKQSIIRLSLLEKEISYESFQELVYYITNFEIPVNDRNKGVLFVDANSSAFVNRPLCFYLGLDNEWNRFQEETENKNSLKDKDKDIERFQILLQQGSQQFYFVSELTSNHTTLPCSYFNIVQNRIVSGFLDNSFRPIKIKNKSKETNPRRLLSKAKQEKYVLDFFSQSSFNNFVTCPKKYSYSKTLPPEGQPSLLKGTLLHEFAEFYFECPDFVKEKGLEEFVGIMATHYRRMVGDLNIDYEKSIFRIGAKNIISFIDSAKIKDLGEVSFAVSKRKKDNTFSKIFGIELNSPRTEAEFSDLQNGIKGIIDLLIGKNLIVDYKTSGKAKTPHEIITSSNLNLIKDRVDFQPFFYIMELMKNSGEDEIKFIYNFVLANRDEIVDGNEDNTKNLVEVCYIPMTFSEFLATGKSVALLSKSKERSLFIAAMKDYKRITDFFRQNPMPKDIQYDAEKLLLSDYASRFRRMAQENLGSRFSFFENAVDSFLKAIVWIRTGERQEKALIFREDIDEFKGFLGCKKEEINIFLNSRFPFSPMDEDACNVCEFKDICLKRYNDD